MNPAAAQLRITIHPGFDGAAMPLSAVTRQTVPTTGAIATISSLRSNPQPAAFQTEFKPSPLYLCGLHQVRARPTEKAGAPGTTVWPHFGQSFDGHNPRTWRGSRGPAWTRISTHLARSSGGSHTNSDTLVGIPFSSVFGVGLAATLELFA